MEGPLHQFFTEDHRRIDDLLVRATKNVDHIDFDLYNQFRVALLTHIKLEEKTLFPAAQKGNGGEPIPMAKQLRLEHGALTSLMVPPPTATLIKVILRLLEIHDEVEEKQGGIYELCENLTLEYRESLLGELKAVTATPLHPLNEHPIALEAAKRAITRAGYDYDSLASAMN